MTKYPWQTSPELGRKLKPLARQMRKEPTGAEAKLWQYLRKRQVRGRLGGRPSGQNGVS